MKWPLIAAVLLLAACAKQESKPAYFKVDPSTAATLTGRAIFTGKSADATIIDMDQDPECKKLYPDGKREDKPVEIGPDGGLANAFVYVKSGLEGKSFEPPATTARIDQKGCWFAPRVSGIQVGQPLEVTNSDPVTHNIHPLAQVNREWNQSQAPQDPPLKRRFAAPEVMIRVKCNVHKWMRSWIGVLPHPYFFATGPDGRFTIPNLPPGNYTLVAWHETLGTRELSVTLAPGAQSQLEFKFNGQ
jgi:plastocyanin